jgi:uncharacterized protein YceH (UPF0502 family)
MDATLDPVEVRVIGCLIEKRVTTPEYYPLTLNSLVLACNQTTNRDPVTSYDEGAVGRALESLRIKALVWTLRGGRAIKYEHRFAEKFKLAAPEMAVMCVLMLRGPQTTGEIRGRTGRLHAFAGLEEVDAAIESLTRSDPPLVTKLPRAPGTKESRFAHLLGSEVAVSMSESSSVAEPVVEPRHDDDRIARLESEVAAIRDEIETLRREFQDLKTQGT